MIEWLPKDKPQFCELCERQCHNPSYPKYLEKDMKPRPPYMCKTCWAIWYDGQTDPAIIKKYSLLWPVDFVGAYCTESKEDMERTIKFANQVESTKEK